MTKACAHLQIKPRSDGKIVMRKDGAWRCNYPVPDPPPLPVSITGDHSFRWPPSRRFVCAEDCAVCPCFTARSKP